MLELRHLRKSFSGFVATNDVSLSLAEGEITAVIGPNGAGKSTLFNLITGHLTPDQGQVLLDERDIAGVAPHRICQMGIARSFQRTNIFEKLTAYENVQASFIAHRRKGLDMWRRASMQCRAETQAMLHALGLFEVRDAIAGELSHGTQKQIELAIALAGEPRILLLDEPTAGMSVKETRHVIELLAQIARERKLTLLFTEHDMDVVFAIAGSIAVLHQGRIIASGTPQDVRRSELVRSIYLGGQRP
jgi:branched-chain amino acid transport system ATP-binding protein